MDAIADIRPADNAALKAELRRRARAEGFDVVGVTAPGGIGPAGERLAAFLERDFHGDMDWLEAHGDRRRDPRALWPDVRSIIMLGMNYGPEHDPLAILGERSRGAISVYARGTDYHDVIKGKLKTLGTTTPLRCSPTRSRARSRISSNIPGR
jgi:epoxyqueuosine reductase